MKTSPSLDDVLREFIDSLANEFLLAKPSHDGNATELSVEEFVSSVEQRFRSTLRDRLAELATRRSSELAETQDYSPHRAGQPPSAVAATIDLSNHGGASRATEKKTEREATYDTLALSADDHATVHARSGETPPEYQILGLLGKGGMGVVYKALHTPLNRIVAVKMILSAGHASHEQILRFKREAEAAAHLVHPNIVQVYAVGEYHGMPYFSLEYVDGESMSALLRRTPLTDDRAATLMTQVCRAVHYSHQRGVLHRDLKPQNILIANDGTPKVADFGLAKRLEDDAVEQTHTGDVLGTPGYMAPEQARGEKSVGPHSDVYSLGAILYCVLTGRAPFVGPTPFETIRQVVAEDPVPPSRLQPKMNRDLETICLRALEKDVSKRYQTAEELADELQRVVEGQPILARPITARERMWKWCKRNPKIAILSSLAATLLLVLLAGGYIAAGVINTQKIAEQDARKEADANAVLARKAEATAKENEALAEDQANLALDATRIMLYETQKFFKARPQLNELRQSMLDGILKEIDRVYAVNTEHEVKEAFQASALRQLGQIYFEAGVYETALEHFLKADEIGTRLANEGRLSQPELSLEKVNLGIGDTLTQLGRYDEAEVRYERMTEYRKKYFELHPEISPFMVELSLAEGKGRLGSLYRRQGRLDEALPLIQSTLDTSRKWYSVDRKSLEKSEKLSGDYAELSKLYEQQGRIPEMTAASKASLELLRRSAANKSDVPTIVNLAKALRMVGRQHWMASQLPEAEQHLREAIENYERALLMDPDSGTAQAQGADAYYLLASLQLSEGKECAGTAKRGIEILEPLLLKSNILQNQELMLKLIAAQGRVDEAVAKADAFAGNRKSEYHCLIAAIIYGLTSLHLSDDPERKQEMLSKGVELIRIAVNDLKFDQLSVLRTDHDFSMFQDLPQFQSLLDANEKRVSE